MGFIPAYWFLKNRYPNGEGVPVDSSDPYAERGVDKLETLLWPGVYDELRGKTVVDFGCGTGEQAVTMAERGARVIGLDIVEEYLEEGRRLAARKGVDVTFATQVEEKADVIVSLDAFEHFADPAAILNRMASLLKPDGCVLVSFGYMWGHPLGGHLFSPFPWAHLILTESSLMRWRADFRPDRPRKHFTECGLNKITLRRWERIVEESPLRFDIYNVRPIRAARRFHCRLTRELLTSTICARLVLR